LQENRLEDEEDDNEARGAARDGRKVVTLLLVLPGIKLIKLDYLGGCKKLQYGEEREREREREKEKGRDRLRRVTFPKLRVDDGGTEGTERRDNESSSYF